MTVKKKIYGTSQNGKYFDNVLVECFILWMNIFRISHFSQNKKFHKLKICNIAVWITTEKKKKILISLLSIIAIKKVFLLSLCKLLLTGDIRLQQWDRYWQHSKIYHTRVQTHVHIQTQIFSFVCFMGRLCKSTVYSNYKVLPNHLLSCCFHITNWIIPL